MSDIATAMTKPRVVVTHWVHPEVIDSLNGFCEPVLNQTSESLSRDELLSRCQEADGIMAFMPDRIDEDFLEHCPRLRVVAAALKGYDNIDLYACSRRGILVTIAEDLLTEPTAELAVALTLGVCRNLLPGDARVRSGAFRGWRPVLYGLGLTGATVGLVGFGAVGQAYARRMRAFGCRMIYFDEKAVSPLVDEELGVAPQSLEGLLTRADVVALFLPLTEQTRYLIDGTALSLMKDSAYLVNVCRGSVVNEAAVAEALREDRLAGYAADVFEMEDLALPDRPEEVHPNLLANHDRTLLTPHLGSAVDSVRKSIAMQAAQQLESALCEEPAPDVVSGAAVNADLLGR